ncbi:MAG: pyridoxal phosphate-dependent aminotransferase family protein [Clostridiales bacterium]|nr:pyridoxal phosphate-dependent aminotransferase family protein [Clostridiales bacterium]
MDIFEKCFSFTQAKEVMKQGIYPWFHQLESGQDTEVVINGKRTIMIGSNNYLGLTSDPRVIQAAHEALDKFGSGCSGSRFLNGTLTLHVELEKKLAAFVRKEDALTFSTGFQTNLGIISTIAGRNDYIICDNANHASIVDGCRLSFAKVVKFEHNDMADLERVLCNINDKFGKLIVVDGIFSMEGDICNLPDIVKLAKKCGARVMVDDAHGLGVLGKYGRGTAEHFGLEDEVDIIMSTFSKSLASLGGFIAAKEEVIHFVKHFSRPFIFSASIPPANAAAAMKALEILEAEPERVATLWDNANYMRAGLKKLKIPIGDSVTPIIPIMTWENNRTFIITKMLLDEGVFVNPVISPAVKPGNCLLRTSYTATHTKGQLDFALAAFEKVFSSVPADI